MKINHLFLSLLAAVMLTACEPSQPPATQQKSDSAEKKSPPQEPNPSANAATEQALESTQALTDNVSNNGAADEPNSIESELSQQNDNAQSPQTGAGDSIIESIGFADAETETPDSESEQQYQPHCNTFASQANSKQNTEKAAFCEKISNRLASVSLSGCMSADLVPSGCSSIAGTPLMITEFAPLEKKEPLGRVLIIGGIHGDELTSVSVTFRWIEKLNKYHSGLFHWHIIPSMNPDGLLKKAAERTNENGVDLNRNLPSNDWTKNALAYWESKSGKDPRKYPGKTPNSEPETHWLVDEIQQFKPDAIISIHAPYGVVDFDAQQLNTAPKSLGKLRLNLLGTYPGSLGNYAGINKNIPVITLELPHAWEMPSEAETDLIWQDIVSWLKKNLPERNG